MTKRIPESIAPGPEIIVLGTPQQRSGDRGGRGRNFFFGRWEGLDGIGDVSNR